MKRDGLLTPSGKCKEPASHSNISPQQGRSMHKITAKEYAVVCAEVYCRRGSLYHFFRRERLTVSRGAPPIVMDFACTVLAVWR